MSGEDSPAPHDDARTLDEVREMLAGTEHRRQDRRIEALEAKLAVTIAKLDRLNQQVELLKAQQAGKPGRDDGGSTDAAK